jgi:hypothetical protein
MKHITIVVKFGKKNHQMSNLNSLHAFLTDNALSVKVLNLT